MKNPLHEMNMALSYTMHQIPMEERPRERLLRFGSEAMSTAELIAIILGSGTKQLPVIQLAQQLTARFGSLRALAEASVPELCEARGMGKAKAIQLKAALTLGLRAAQVALPERYRVENPQHVYLYLKGYEERKEEHFLAIFLDIRGHVLGHEVIAIGSLYQATVHPREVFYKAIRQKAASMIVAHNHPSGDPTPSTADYDLTRQLLAAAQFLHIPIQDHVIIGKGTFYSLREKEPDRFCWE